MPGGKGHRGHNGLEGAKGDMGSTGEKGATGAAGPIGPTGAIVCIRSLNTCFLNSYLCYKSFSWVSCSRIYLFTVYLQLMYIYVF